MYPSFCTYVLLYIYVYYRYLWSYLHTISPFGPLNPCGPFSPTSPWRHQMKHTQLFIDGTSHLSWLQSATRCCVYFLLLFWRAWQTRRDSLSCRWCRRRLVCLWSPANPGDKVRNTHGEHVNETFAPWAWKKLQRGERDSAFQKSLTRSPTAPIGPCKPLRPRGPWKQSIGRSLKLSR